MPVDMKIKAFKKIEETVFRFLLPSMQRLAGLQLRRGDPRV